MVDRGANAEPSPFGGADPVAAYFDDGAVLVVPDSGAVYALNLSAAFIHRALSEGGLPQAVAAGLARAYGIPLQRAETDVARFLSHPATPVEQNVAIDDSPFRFEPRGDDFVVTRDRHIALILSARGEQQQLTIPPDASVAAAGGALRWITPKLAVLQGTPVMHASAVRLPGAGATAFAGPSGAGKTTLATMLGVAGADLLCEDSFFVDFTTPEGRPRLIPFEGTAAAWAEDMLAGARPGKSFEVSRPALATEPALPLDGIAIVDRKRRSGTRIALTSLAPTDATAAILRNLFWARVDRRSCETALAWARRIADTVPVSTVSVPDGLEALATAARGLVDPR